MSETKERCWYVRAMRPSDREYVRLTWLNNYRESAVGIAAKMPRDLYRRCWGKMIDAVMRRAEVRIACTDDDADTIVGFAVLVPRERVIHYVYTREGWRELGVAGDLVADLLLRECSYSHCTDALERKASDAGAGRRGAKVPAQWHHAPWLLVTMALDAGGVE